MVIRPSNLFGFECYLAVACVCVCVCVFVCVCLCVCVMNECVWWSVQISSEFLSIFPLPTLFLFLFSAPLFLQPCPFSLLLCLSLPSSVMSLFSSFHLSLSFSLSLPLSCLCLVHSYI